MELHHYSSCSYCGCTVEEQHVRIEMWFGDSLTVFEHVPAGVCEHCGEEYFRADIQDKLIALTKTPAKKTMNVPVYSFSDPLTVAKAAAKRKKKEELIQDDRENDVPQIATDEELANMLETNLEEWEDEL